ncbi:trypsin-like serine peptidase [Microbispora sp. H10949]|uniref:trypsin-like serine peptidase n=1 Tax=Microbispora sp. H10949 TaxID=2729111 RepID=UPI0016030E3F|nr:trypsin-like serine protease [Microbispora sp. H10949]
MTRKLALAGGVAAAAGLAAVLWSQGPATPATASPQLAAAPVSVVSGLGRSVAGDSGVSRDGVSSFALAPKQADKERVAAYWSPDRLKQASSYVPSTKPSPSVKSTTSALEMVPGEASRGATPPLRAAVSAPGDAPPMVGKVFFKVGDKQYWCSASAVHSAHRNLVATAGHCAYALAQDKPVENWIFIPSYHDGVAPKGIFVGHTLYMHEDFAGQGDFDRDYAFVTVHRGFTWQPYTQQGRFRYRAVDVGRLEDKVGAFLFTSAKPLARRVSAFGYPAGAHPDGTRPYDGQTVRTCSGTTEKKIVSAPTWQLEHGVRLPGCAFTAGASGGPWVVGYNPAKRTGRLTGVTSLTWNLSGGGRLDAVSTPYFNTLTRRVYTQAGRQGTG